MEWMIVGDLHGNTGEAMRMVDRAVERGVHTIIQLGDFGIWPGPNGDSYLRKFSKYMLERDVNCFFTDGNHEDFPKLYKNQIDPETGWRPVQIDGMHSTRIYHVPRGHVWEAEGLRFMAVGGAVSIDRGYRIPGKSWWPEETLTGEDLERVRQQGQVDVLFTHDAPTSVPMKNLKPDLESARHRLLMNKVADYTQPTLWFHGHMHHPMHYWHRTRDDFGLDIEVIGLDCDGTYDNYCFFDLSSRTVDFPTDTQDTTFRQRVEPWYSRGYGWWPNDRPPAI